MRLATDMGLPDAKDYETKLKKAEKVRELRDQVLKLNCTVLYKLFIMHLQRTTPPGRSGLRGSAGSTGIIIIRS